ncbi:MAG: MoaD/ThiS family protein [Chloroflexi bacterium]|nr:MoaD/ThiS family protein [Chloroflexota bacterium]
MAKIQLKLPPSLVSIIDKKAADWITLEPEIGEGSTIGELLARLAAENQEFRQSVFDPAAGKVNDEMMIVLNDILLQHLDITETKLKEGDSIMLFPVYSGG